MTEDWIDDKEMPDWVKACKIIKSYNDTVISKEIAVDMLNHIGYELVEVDYHAYARSK